MLYSHELTIPREDDCVTLDVLDDSPSEEQLFDLPIRWRSLGNDLEIGWHNLSQIALLH